MEHATETGSSKTDDLEAEVAAIRRTVADVELHQNDVEPLIALHAPDAMIVNVAGRRVLGAAAFEEAMRQAVASPLAKVLTRIEIEDIRFVRPDVAIVSCVKHISDERDARPRDDSDALPSAGRLTYVMAKAGDSWRIELAQTTPIGG